MFCSLSLPVIDSAGIVGERREVLPAEFSRKGHGEKLRYRFLAVELHQDDFTALFKV